MAQSGPMKRRLFTAASALSLMQVIAYSPPLPSRRRSGMGIASSIVAIAAVAIVGARRGTAMGVISLCQRRRHCGLAVVGLLEGK